MRASSSHFSPSLCVSLSASDYPDPFSHALLFFPSLSPSSHSPLAPTEARGCVGPRRDGGCSPWHPGPCSSWVRPGERGQRGGEAPDSARREGWHRSLEKATRSQSLKTQASWPATGTRASRKAGQAPAGLEAGGGEELWLNRPGGEVLGRVGRGLAFLGSESGLS